MNIENRTLFIADNLDIMRGIDSECIDLIYLDPPFKSGKEWKAPIGSPAEGAKFKDIWTDEDIKHEWHGQVAEEHEELYQIIQASERVHDKSMKIYLMAMAVRLFEMQRILKPTGSIYLHCDPTASHYLKLVMDDIFGNNHYQNEVVWHYPSMSRASTHFPKKNDIILFYTKGDNYIFNADNEHVRVQYADSTKQRAEYGGAGFSRKEGKANYLKSDTKLADTVWKIPHVKSKKESTGYPTQKPVKLIQRIIAASSNEGDVVLDPFCGCATACVAAEQLRRQWIGIDISPAAETITKIRLQEEVDAEAGLFNPLSDVIVSKVTPTRTDDTTIAYQRQLPTAGTHKAVLYGQQEGRCNGCQYPFYFRNLTIDHIVPQSKGGTDHLDNLQLLCGACNSTKGNGTHEQFIQNSKIPVSCVD